MSGMYLDVNAIWVQILLVVKFFYYNRWNFALGFVFCVFVWVSYKLSVSDYFQG